MTECSARRAIRPAEPGGRVIVQIHGTKTERVGYIIRVFSPTQVTVRVYPPSGKPHNIACIQHESQMPNAGFGVCTWRWSPNFN